MDALMGYLQIHEQRLLTKKKDNVSQDLRSKLSLREDQKTLDNEVNQRGRGRGRGGGRGCGGQGSRNFYNHEERSTFSDYANASGIGGYGRRGFGRGRGQRNSKFYIQCFNYNKHGYYVHEYWSIPQNNVKESKLC